MCSPALILAALLVLILAVAGCDSSSPQDRSAPPQPRADRQTAPPPDEPAPPRPTTSPEERLIQAWIAAIQLEDYRRAGSFFARGAIVDQGFPERLETRADAIEFNRGLPCRADVVKVEDEGRTTLATFQLYDGPGGSCEGSVRVRFTIRQRKFEVFRQLPDTPADGGFET